MCALPTPGMVGRVGAHRHIALVALPLRAAEGTPKPHKRHCAPPSLAHIIYNEHTALVKPARWRSASGGVDGPEVAPHVLFALRIGAKCQIELPRAGGHLKRAHALQ